MATIFGEKNKKILPFFSRTFLVFTRFFLKPVAGWGVKL
jgi:hypothetical protein